MNIYKYRDKCGDVLMLDVLDNHLYVGAVFDGGKRDVCIEIPLSEIPGLIDAIKGATREESVTQNR